MSSRHKLALLTMVGAYPTIVLLLTILDPVMGDAPKPVKAVVLVPLMVIALSYGVMPLLARIFANWLHDNVRTRFEIIALVATLAVVASSAAVAVDRSSEDTQTKLESALDGMAIDHIMVNVSDFEDSVKWYTDKLGFKETVRWTVDGLPGTNLAYLKRGAFLIEVVSGPTSEQTVSLPRATDFSSHFAQRGFTHLCFKVQDVDAALAKLNAIGVPTFSPAIDFPALNTRVGFIQDPDGNVIEFKGPMAGTNVVRGTARWVE